MSANANRVQNGGWRGPEPRKPGPGSTSAPAQRTKPLPKTDEDENVKGDDSHEAMKNSQAFKGLFECFDALTLKAAKEREWQCPACKGGAPKGIASYKGIDALLNHARATKNWDQMLHRKLVKVLDEELKRRTVARSVAQQVYGRWVGLDNAHENLQVPWPPMVVVRNTNFQLQDNQRIIGMGNNELLECFKEYKPTKAKYASGPKGHCGISLLMFEDSALGYLEADRLHKNFLKEERGRDNWNQNGMVVHHPSGKHTLYGYIATNHDIDDFNKQSTKGNIKVKYEMVSYQIKVIEPISTMKEDSAKVSWLEQKIAEDKQRTRNLEENINDMANKLHIQQEEIKILMKKAIEQDEECKKGLDHLEHFYKQEIDRLLEDATKRHKEIEKIQEDIKRTQQEHSGCGHLPEIGSSNPTKDINAMNQVPQAKIQLAKCNIQ